MIPGYHRRLAQLGERLLYTQRVGGSSPSMPTSVVLQVRNDGLRFGGQ
jgi:hypothetical protein